MMMHKMVKNHLKLTEDGECEAFGHELIPRACIHCGMTIHEIANANEGYILTRQTPDKIANTIKYWEREIESIEEDIHVRSDKIEEIQGFINELNNE